MYNRLIKIGLYLIISSGILSGIYFYYTSTKNEISSLKDTITKYKIINNESEKTIQKLKDDNKKSILLNQKLQKDLKKSESYNTELQKILRKHNLTLLSLKKPLLIERRINEGTSKVFNDIINDTIINND